MGARSGPIDIRATLPGLVVAVAVAVGSEVTAGDALLTVEASRPSAKAIVEGIGEADPGSLARQSLSTHSYRDCIP